jgi:hypothetical protein
MAPALVLLNGTGADPSPKVQMKFVLEETFVLAFVKDMVPGAQTAVTPPRGI